MKAKAIFSVMAISVVGILASSQAVAMCYSIPHTSSYQSTFFLQGFEGDASSCPQASSYNWMEVCARPSGSSANYSLCGSGYAVPGQQFTAIRLNYNTAYDYRVRYQKTDNTLDVVTYGSFPAVSNGNTGGGINPPHPNCPPYNPNCDCPAGYPMGHPLCD